MDETTIAQELETAELNTEKGDIFFIERIGDGYIFACTEREAWNTLSNSSTWKRRDFRIVGTSDGKIFRKIVSQAREEKLKIKAELAQLQKQLDKYTATEEKFLFEDLLDKDDPKVKRVRELIDKTLEELEPIQAKLKNYSQRIVSEAHAAELEEARKHPRMPKNQNLEAPGGDKEDIVALMGKRLR